MAFDISARQHKLLRLLWEALLALVVVLSLVPATAFLLSLASGMSVNDKVVHFVSYMILGFLPAIHEQGRTLTWLVLLIILVGILLEFAQFWIPNRSCELGDILADCCGALTGVVFGVLFRRWFRTSSDQAEPA